MMKRLTVSAIISAVLILAAGTIPARGQDAAAIEVYPIDFCIVSGQKLGSMGPAVDYLHEGRLVRFCCSGCVRTFQNNPDRYLAELDKHQAAVAPAAEVVAEPVNPAPSACGKPMRPGCSH